jgi:hypothetical protein
MRDDLKHPNNPEEDPAIDRALTGLGRFSPRQGFEDRVVSRVRVPLPQWLRGLRDAIRSVTSGVTGWTMLVTFSIATVASWVTGAVYAARYWDPIWVGVGAAAHGAVAGAREVLSSVVFPAIQTGWAEVTIWLAGIGLDPKTVLIGYGVVVLICLVALRWLTADPARTRGVVDATQ